MSAPLPVGSIVYLTSCLIKAQVKSEETMPDTPSLYSADLALMNESGHLDTSNLAGKAGLDGQTLFSYRRMDNDNDRTTLQDLPQNLTNDAEDLGKYWVISTYDSDGTITEQWAWVWHGVHGYRKTFMGSRGPAGPVPKIRPLLTVIDEDTASYVDTGGSIMAPTWRFNVASPVGDEGPVRALNSFPDFAPDPNVAKGAILMHDGTRGTASPVTGMPIFRPANIQALIPRVYTVPESGFINHTGTWQNIRESSKVNVGSFTVPAQPFDWTPVVWGHTSTGRFFNPFKIGLEVRMGKENGLLLARGYGNRRGEVYVVPHYTGNTDKNANVSPTNGYAKVESGQPVTVYMNLTNEGQFGMYDFSAANAQLCIMVSPIDAYNSYTPPTTKRVR